MVSPRGSTFLNSKGALAMLCPPVLCLSHLRVIAALRKSHLMRNLFTWSITLGVAGCNPGANPTNAILTVSNAGSAIYKGATLAQANGTNFLYVANFFNGSVDVFDKNYVQVPVPPGAFTDPDIRSGFVPFNVQNIGGNIYATFAKQSSNKHD